MATNNFTRSDLYLLHNIVQSSMLTFPKEMIISTLRDFFSKDTSYYHYAKDKWGFPNTTDHTDLPLGNDIPTTYQQDSLSTRLFIGENYHFDKTHYPAILVKNNGSKYVPISINREQGSVQYEDIIYEDNVGNQTLVKRPKYFITAGIWEGSIIIDVQSRSLRARDDLVELISYCFTEINFQTLYESGIIVKPIIIGSPSETEDRNDKMFKQSITMDIRTEWRREIPIGNIIETIMFTMQFSDIENNGPVANNMTINTEVDLTDMILSI